MKNIRSKTLKNTFCNKLAEKESRFPLFLIYILAKHTDNIFLSISPQPIFLSIKLTIHSFSFLNILLYSY